MNIKRKIRVFKFPSSHYKPIYFLVLAVVLFLFLVFYLKPTKSKKICIKGACIQAEVVIFERDRQKGLMYRSSLGQDNGMLFIFKEEDYHGFWMKNMEFPLDIVWIGPDKKIVDIYHRAIPCRESTCNIILPKYPAIFVLELNSGFAKDHNINIGDKVAF